MTGVCGMIIKENVAFALVEGDSYTLTHKGKITQKKGKGHITCEVVFRTLNTDRKVNYNTTGLIICEIKRWIKIYTKDVPPDTEKTTYLPNSKKAKEYIDKWIHWESALIPENSAINEIGFAVDFTKQHFVRLNDKLLEPNKLLSYNQALFLLLGLNAIELGKQIRNFPLLDGDKPNEPIEGFFWETLQNHALKSSPFVVNGKITSEDLITLAETNGFFRKPLQNRNIPKDAAEKLYKALLDRRFITGEFNDLWKWAEARNQLAYLAKKLKQKRILGGECHKELSYYIQDPKPHTKKPLKNIKDPANTSAIDTIVVKLTG